MKSLRIQGWFLLVGLVMQYALGMYVNLFVSFPDGLNEGQLWEFAWSQPALAAHIVLAILIFLGGIVLCIRAYLQQDKRWIWASFVGLLAVLAAGASGASFIPTQGDIYSYSMALFFIVAFGAYAWGLFGGVRASS
jgi:hypothetical protein